jgi:hypothetical protein
MAMGITLRALRSTTLAGLAVTLTLGPGTLAASAATSSDWRIAATVGSASSQVGDADLAVSGPSDAWATFTCGPCPSGAQPHQNLMLHWNGQHWNSVTLPAELRYPTVIAGMQSSSARNTWVFTDDQRVTVFNGSRWSVKKLPAWVERPVSGTDASVASAVFSPTDVWAFSLEAASQPTLAAHDIKGTWHKVFLPIVPSQVDAVTPSDIWLSGFGKNFGPRELAHWNGKSWRTLSFPSVPKGATLVPSGLVATGRRSLWTLGEEFGPKSGSVTFKLLHWTGHWTMITVPSSIGETSQVASDGHGGLWLITTKMGPKGAAGTRFAHYSGGHWSTAAIPAKGKLQSELGALASVPGSRSMWAIGFLVDGSKPEFGEILRFGG